MGTSTPYLLSPTVRRVILPRPKPHQVPEILSPARFKISVHGRRWGKSTMGLMACLAGHGPDRLRKGALEGGTVWWVAPNLVVGRIIWRLLKAATRDAWLAKDEVEKRIDFYGGGSVTIKTAEGATSLRGEGLDGLVVDEAAFLAEGLWQEELRATLSDRQGWAWFITTPKGRNWFYRLFQAAQGMLGWASWQGPTTTQTASQEELDQAKAELGSFAYRQEYLAEFAVQSAGFFRPEHFRYYQNGGATYRLGDRAVEISACRKVTTVDLAASLKTSADYTVVTTSAITPSKDLIVLDCDRVRLEGPDQVPLIRKHFEKWRGSIKIESVGYQLALIQAAIRDGLPVSEIKRDKDKVSRACLLQARMDAHAVWFPEPEHAPAWVRVMENELVDFTTDDSHEHDDIMDTLADAAYECALAHNP